jgi:hypothetical protein
MVTWTWPETPYRTAPAGIGTDGSGTVPFCQVTVPSEVISQVVVGPSLLWESFADPVQAWKEVGSGAAAGAVGYVPPPLPHAAAARTAGQSK